jgi:Uncharacterized homolog of PSP1
MIEINNGDINETTEVDEVSAAPAASAVPESKAESYLIVGIRYKENGKIYYFDPDGSVFERGDQVIVDTARGIEFGTIAKENTLVPLSELTLPLRKVLRTATPEDIAHHEEIEKKKKEAFAICQEKINEHNPEMKLIDVEYTFDNTKLMFYFTADRRVDFRELVKDLAAIFKMRIELRQIRPRDSARFMGGLGSCGRPFCCSTFLSNFVQISVKMAKEQNISLNPAKISGTCGLLMCCLQFEHQTYEEEIKRTPPVDTKVKTPDGVGTIIETSPLSGNLKVMMADRKIQTIHRDKVTVIEE